jgi:hypothetical protein
MLFDNTLCGEEIKMTIADTVRLVNFFGLLKIQDPNIVLETITSQKTYFKS